MIKNPFASGCSLTSCHVHCPCYGQNNILLRKQLKKPAFLMSSQLVTSSHFSSIMDNQLFDSRSPYHHYKRYSGELLDHKPRKNYLQNPFLRSHLIGSQQNQYQSLNYKTYSGYSGLEVGYANTHSNKNKDQNQFYIDNELQLQNEGRNTNYYNYHLNKKKSEKKFKNQDSDKQKQGNFILGGSKNNNFNRLDSNEQEKRSLLHKKSSDVNEYNNNMFNSNIYGKKDVKNSKNSFSSTQNIRNHGFMSKIPSFGYEQNFNLKPDRISYRGKTYYSVDITVKY